MRPSNWGRFILNYTVIAVLLVFNLSWEVVSLGSMSTIAVSYGDKGHASCVLRSDGSRSVSCYGSNDAIVNATPHHLTFLGLTGGSGFICGLMEDSKHPFCWGSSMYIPIGSPLGMTMNSEYVEISAGDYQLCGLRKPSERNSNELSLVDCWGYNMTRSYTFNGKILSISSGSLFCCGLFANNGSAFCWGDDLTSKLIPKALRFRKIAAGGYHVCGILEGLYFKVVCWGTLDVGVKLLVSPVRHTPLSPMASVVGGKFHACGIRMNDGTVVCWGYRMEGSTTPPPGVRFRRIAAGDYFTCGELPAASLPPICWGDGFPSTLPVPVDLRHCHSSPCWRGYYQFNNASTPCRSPGFHVCLPCRNGCPDEMFKVYECSLASDMVCGYNCTKCKTIECFSNCSSHGSGNTSIGDSDTIFWSIDLGIFVAEISVIVLLVALILLSMALCIRCMLRKRKPMPVSKTDGNQANGDCLKIWRARMFTYEELDRATGGFKEESIVGKGSFSSVFKGVLMDGTTVAVKKATVSHNCDGWTCFKMELDLLSRLNHAHLLRLLGYCEERDERLLVYEFMTNGSLYQHLHGPTKESKEQLDWMKRITIAVQASRGIEYLHGYAFPPVIHRDIKSSNILIDAEYNAHVADFGLSLLGPTNGTSPLAELPAGTFGYLDPEYYKLHYLTTKSDVYSFGVLLLEILSGRKAVDLRCEEGNIVEWAVPLVRAGNVEAVLDPVLECHLEIEPLKRIANVACRCVRMRGRDRPSMDQVTTALELSLAMLMSSPSDEQNNLLSKAVLGCRTLQLKPALEMDRMDQVDEPANRPSASLDA
ncbi:serine/threonine-protein kinase-like protein ACR4 [Andrographis paniculata]|uniref:serine/threonine-protein kinase-like protein ACR4 n=1 Tax=Andrographis paniculata TaxID=175694 RepID=UPI0021E6E916|nr:serine/threonine-protein kinase-like protein ACR4 [Andrographis paniculata]